MIYPFVFLIGLSIGSFLGVIVFRLDKKSGILTGRSECFNCLKQIKWYDLFPVLSYVFLKGRCRNCRSTISPTYLLLELTTALCFLLFYIFRQPIFGVEYLFYLLIVTSFVVLIFFDYLYLLLPDKIIIPVVFIVFLFNYFFRRPEFVSLLLSALILFLIGLVLGYPLGFISFLFSVWTAALTGIGLMMFGKANRKTALPFGSFLAGVSIIIIIFQNEIQKITNQFL